MELIVKRNTSLPAGIVIQMVNKTTTLPYDLTGCEIHCQIRKSFESNAILHWKLTAEEYSGMAWIDQSIGKWSISPQVISLPPAKYVFDFQIRFAGGKIMNVIPSTLIVNPVSTTH